MSSGEAVFFPSFSTSFFHLLLHIPPGLGRGRECLDAYLSCRCFSSLECPHPLGAVGAHGLGPLQFSHGECTPSGRHLATSLATSCNNPLCSLFLSPLCWQVTLSGRVPTPVSSLISSVCLSQRKIAFPLHTLSWCFFAPSLYPALVGDFSHPPIFQI